MNATKVILNTPDFDTACDGAIEAAIEAGNIICGRNEAVFKAQLEFAVWLLAAKETAKTGSKPTTDQRKGKLQK